MKSDILHESLTLNSTDNSADIAEFFDISKTSAAEKRSVL